MNIYVFDVDMVRDLDVLKQGIICQYTSRVSVAAESIGDAAFIASCMPLARGYQPTATLWAWDDETEYGCISTR